MRSVNHINEQKKYSVVSYLENKSYEKVRAIQEKLFELTGSRKCLDAWSPHLTIGSGILVAPEQQQEVDKMFETLSSIQKLFDVELSGFGGITNWKGAKEGVVTPYVLWIDVVVNEKLLELFKLVADTVISKYETWLPRITEYIPHVTVAYADLSQEGYEKGREYLKTLNFKEIIQISHIALVENFPEKDIEYKRFPFERMKENF